MCTAKCALVGARLVSALTIQLDLSAKHKIVSLAQTDKKLSATHKIVSFAQTDKIWEFN